MTGVVPELLPPIEDRENLFGDICQLLVGAISSEACERSSFRVALDSLEPLDLIPSAAVDDYRNYCQAFRFPALKESRHLLALDERRAQEVSRDKEHGDARAGHSFPDLFEPVRTGLDAFIAPEVEETLGLQNSEMGLDSIFPDFVLAAVAQEDGGGHCERILAQDIEA